jgi:hypothetical protein
MSTNILDREMPERQLRGYRIRARRLGDFVYFQHGFQGYHWNEYPAFPRNRSWCEIQITYAKEHPYREGKFVDRSAVYDLKIVAVFAVKVKKQ